MANGRSGGSKRRRDTGRDAGGFVALPWMVLDSEAYRSLSHPARALLLEVARQYHGGDNGRMLLTDKYLAPRGWTSPAVTHKAKRALLDVGLIHETVKGQRPNKASWYAVTWRELDRIDGFDAGATLTFERGGYLRWKPQLPTSSGVVADPRIATSRVVDDRAATTSRVAMRGRNGGPPTTSRVVPLEGPSVPAVGVGGEDDLPPWDGESAFAAADLIARVARPAE